jgi:hypothetical protein
MSTHLLTRRAALAALGVVALPSIIAVRSARAQPGVRFRAIVVDVSPLRASAGDPTAAWVEEELPGQLAQALAPYLSPGDRNGATLVALIRALYLGPNHGPGYLGSSQDTMEGVLIVRGPRGGIAADTPLRAISTYYPNPFDQPLRTESNRSRVAALAQAFAGWAPRELGL